MRRSGVQLAVDTEPLRGKIELPTRGRPSEPAQSEYGAGKQASVEIHAAEMRARSTLQLLPRVRGADLSETAKIEIARKLLRLQGRKILQVWIDHGEKIFVAPFPANTRPTGVTRTAGKGHRISWARAAQIADRGGLE